MTEQPSKDAVLAALSQIPDPDRGRDIVASNAVRELRVEDGRVRFLLALLKTSTPAAEAKARMIGNSEALASSGASSTWV